MNDDTYVGLTQDSVLADLWRNKNRLYSQQIQILIPFVTLPTVSWGTLMIQNKRAIVFPSRAVQASLENNCSI